MHVLRRRPLAHSDGEFAGIRFWLDTCQRQQRNLCGCDGAHGLHCGIVGALDDNIATLVVVTTQISTHNVTDADPASDSVGHP